MKENFWAIAAKGILDAVENRNVAAAVASALFIVGMYRALPTMESGDGSPNVRVYDGGDEKTTLEDVFVALTGAELRRFEE
jgi:hypothetical protein